MKIALYAATPDEKIAAPFSSLGYLSASLKQRFAGRVEVKIFRKLAELIRYRPALAGISAASAYYVYAIAAARRIKKNLDCTVVLGGYHITGLPGSLTDDFDAGVIGEGELTLGELVSALLKNNRDPARWSGIKGLVFHHAGKLVFTGPRAAIRDLDRLPFPEPDSAATGRMTFSLTARGCPFRCSYCTNWRQWHGYRAHSPKYVVNELLAVAPWNRGQHQFLDDIFCLDARRVRTIRRLLEAKAPGRLAFTAFARAELLTPEIVRELALLGVGRVTFGLESASDRVLAALKGGAASAARSQRALDLLAGAGIESFAFFIIGTPGEERADLDLTHAFIRRNLAAKKLVGFGFFPLVPFPGTRFWAEAVAAKLINPRRFDFEALEMDTARFDLRRYLHLNPAMTRASFARQYRRFKELMDGG